MTDDRTQLTDDIAVARPGRLRVLAFPAVVYSFAVVMMGTTLPTPLYPEYEREFGFGSLMTTLIFATYAVGVIAALVGVGQFSDTIGRRPMLYAGVALSFVSAVLFLIGGSVEILFVGRLVSGFSAGIFTSTATVAVIEAAPRGRRGMATAVATAANIGGLGLGPLVAGMVTEFAPYPTRTIFVVHAVLLIIAGIGLSLVPETVKVLKGARPTLQRVSVPPSVRGIFTQAAVGAVAGFAVAGLFTAVAPNFMASVLDVSSPTITGLVVFVLFATSALTQILTSKAPVRASLLWGYVGLVAGMAVLIVSLETASLAGLVVGAVIAGASQGLLFSKGIAAIAARVEPHRKADATSAYFVVAYLAISVPIIAVGFAAEAWTLTTAGVAFSGVIAALAAGALVALLTRSKDAI
ncbi:MAG: MFS transporter [Gordonia sp.]|uniref:MFS transporter n=1 Tax=Gordonia rubripertincta TaxID=36822 RepID=A0ABT4MZZ7_GORRU|nr:MFS transporter [Gordonia rubripertincta]MBA4022933.1 MFS transporter [Gordonia sp. (in: high G+C Gram-positive bacteria)]MCZ4552561.1 MFS transporter [Gordonia rubripertincta]